MCKLSCLIPALCYCLSGIAQNEQKMFWALNGSASGFVWDNTTGNNHIDNGNGTWNTTSTNKTWTFNKGISDVAWRPGAAAIFGGNPGTGAAGTVTLAASQIVSSLTFNPAASGNFTLAEGVGSNITLTNLSGNITANASATINASLLGTSGLTLTGTGTITLDSATTYTGTTTINSGTLLLSNGTANSSTPTLSTPIVIASAGTLSVNITSANINLSGNISGAGTLNFTNTTGQLQTFRLYGSNSGFTGNVTQPANARGLMWSDNGGTGNAANTGSAAATWNLNGAFGFIETAGAATPIVQLGSLSGTNTATLLGTFGTGTGIKTFQVGALNTSTSFAGAIQDDPQGGTAVASLTKVGTGTLTLSGTNTYSGATTVNAGTLAFSTAVPSSNTWNIAVNATSTPTSANSGLMTVPSPLTFLGKTVNIILTGASTGFTWTAMTCPTTVLVGPALQINGAGVLSGVASGGTTVTFTGTAITVKR